MQNLEFNIANKHSSIVIGQNGSGKSTLFEVLEIFQQIGRGVSTVEQLIKRSDFLFGNTKMPIEIELEATCDHTDYTYSLIIEYPETFEKPRIKSEKLLCNGKDEYVRDRADTTLYGDKKFSLDWHHVGLPLIETHRENSPIVKFRTYLANIIILSPYPKNFQKYSSYENRKIDKEADNIIDWARWLLSTNPKLYSQVETYLKDRMPDLELFRFMEIGANDKELILTFQTKETEFLSKSKTFDLNFTLLSDGEKIFFLSALVNAALGNHANSVCIWDEPDNYISLNELSDFIAEFRKTVESGSNNSQLIISSHNPKIINRFSNHNIFIISRNSHLHPSRIRLVDEISYISDTLIDAYENGELDYGD